MHSTVIYIQDWVHCTRMMCMCVPVTYHAKKKVLAKCEGGEEKGRN